MENRRSFDAMENVNLHRDGRKVVLESTGTPIVNEDGGLLGYRGSDRDITERKEAEKQLELYQDHLEELVSQRTAALEMANDELKAFSYSVSHDLRSPLRVIDGFSQVVLEDYSNAIDEVGKDFLQRIRNGTHHMEEIIDAMLSLSRVSHVDMKPQDVDLSAIAKSILREFQDSEPKRIATVEVMRGIRAMADKSLIYIVLENLLGNAWKYSKKKQKAYVEFGAKIKGGQTVYFVRDNGAGFEMKYVDKLFGAFQRLHSLEDFEGTGIGLVTVSRIIRRHGGEVWAEAQPGQGATFYFTLDTMNALEVEMTEKAVAQV
jgi:light-regulated signal transduction histidine kinase (bacteriophytochrome)